MDKTTAIGKEKEALAAEYLRKNKVQILEQNFTCRQGEIDIIGKYQGYLLFVEVKYRHTEKYGTPEEAVNFTKQKKICRAADYYRMCHYYYDNVPVRYDVIAITGEQIVWHQNAFEHIYF